MHKLEILYECYTYLITNSFLKQCKNFRPISVGSDFAFPPVYQSGNNFNHGSQETLKDVRDLAAEHKICSIREDSKENLEDTSPTEQVAAQKLLNQMSSGYHTQPSDSRGELKYRISRNVVRIAVRTYCMFPLTFR